MGVSETGKHASSLQVNVLARVNCTHLLARTGGHNGSVMNGQRLHCITFGHHGSNDAVVIHAIDLHSSTPILASFSCAVELDGARLQQGIDDDEHDGNGNQEQDHGLRCGTRSELGVSSILLRQDHVQSSARIAKRKTRTFKTS